MKDATGARIVFRIVKKAVSADANRQSDNQGTATWVGSSIAFRFCTRPLCSPDRYPAVSML